MARGTPNTEPNCSLNLQSFTNSVVPNLATDETRIREKVCNIGGNHAAFLFRVPSVFHPWLNLELLQLAFPEPLWDTLGDNLAALRLSGFAFPFPDVAIARSAFTKASKFGHVIGISPTFRAFCLRSSCSRNRREAKIKVRCSRFPAVNQAGCRTAFAAAIGLPYKGLEPVIGVMS
jgi:hypothetical protein